MKNLSVCILLVACLLTVGCQKTATAPVPGSVNSIDATAFRVTADAQAAITVIKTWQQCSVNSFPPTILVDGVSQVCDPTAGTFPANLKDDLNKAIGAFNTLGAAGKAYHAGASNDTTGLSNAISALEQAISSLLGNSAVIVNPTSPTSASVKMQLAKVQGGK